MSSSSAPTSSSTSKAPSVPLDSSKANVTIASSLSASGTIINPALTNGSIASQANGQDPVISSISATGSVANDITGPSTLDDVNITIKANNLVSNNFLTPDGLHWSANTEVIPITGQVTGQISTENFGQTDGPTIPATTYTMNPGDSGRITNIGTTLAGTTLDMIYQVISTDAASWQNPSESSTACPIGLAFTGEQNIANSDGNSIVALYFGANNVNINYQIVVHNTTLQLPVLASFITTDIDVAQGVKTNLANLLTVIPKTTNLATEASGIIYDTTLSDTDLNGQASLPYGGYLGVGFLSNFDYDFYSPAPARAGNSYQYSQGVRYDLFGSALQAHLTTQVRDIVYLNYYDADENNQLIVPQHQFIWFPNVPWNVPVSTFPHYQYGWQNQATNGNTINVGDYYHIQSTVTYDYYGTDGVYLGQESTTGLYGHAYSVKAPYQFGNYFIEGSTTRSGLYPNHDETLDVYYKYVPPIVYYNTSNPYSTTYYANGYEYVPNYIAPVIYYAPTYDSYGYGGGYSYSSGYVYSSGGGYSNSSGAYYQTYVPQSAYYSKEAQLVAEEREYGIGSTYSIPKTSNESAAWAPALGFGLFTAEDAGESIEVPPVAIGLGVVALVSLVVAGGIWLFSDREGPINKPNRKKQGRELNEEKKNDPKWKGNPNKNSNRAMKKHTPSKKHNGGK